MQIKFSVSKGSLQEKGRREHVQAEECNLCVSEPEEEEPIYVCANQNKIEAQR